MKVSDSVLLPEYMATEFILTQKDNIRAASQQRGKSRLPGRGQGEGHKCRGAGRLRKKACIPGQSAIVKWIAGSERSHILQHKPGREVQRQILG